MSFSDAIGQIDQIVQFEQQLASGPTTTQTSATGATQTDGTSDTSSSSSSSATSFADTLAAAQATTEASAASALTTSTDPTDSDSSDASSLLGDGDSQLLSALSSISSSSSTDPVSALTDSTALDGTSSTDDTSALDDLSALDGSSTADGSSTLDASDSTSDDAALVSALESAEAQTATVSSTSGPTGGEATSASDPRIQAMTEEANALVGKPYVWGGGHDGWGPSSGYDCSGFVSAVLHAGGYLSSPQDTTTLPSASGMEPGPGQYVTVYDRDSSGQEGHTIIDINGQFYESGGEHGSWGGGGGVEKISTPSQSYLSTFNEILHPAGL